MKRNLAADIKIGDYVFSIHTKRIGENLQKDSIFAINLVQLQYLCDLCSEEHLKIKTQSKLPDSLFADYAKYLLMPEYLRDKFENEYDAEKKFAEVKKHYTWHYNFVNIDLFKHCVKPLGIY